MRRKNGLLDRLLRLGCVALTAASASSASAQTQDLRIGTYAGRFTVPRDPAPFEVWMELTVTSVEEGNVRGAAKLLTGKCAGSYVMEGRFAVNKLTMKGSGGPCAFGFSATSEGDKLVGATGAGAPLVLAFEPVSNTNAPSTLVGRYTGSFRVVTATAPSPIDMGMELIVASEERGFVKGTATIFGGPCAGTYAVQGKLDNNKLGLNGSGRPCGFRLTAERQGNRLVGTTGAGFPVQLSR